MKKGSLYIFTLLYLLIGVSIFMSPSAVIFAQDDSVEEIFWGDEDEGDLDEDFEFSEDDEFSEDEFSDDGSDDFSEDFSEAEEDIGEAATRLGYTLNLSGSSPGFVNHQLQTYNSSY